jgi:hypothetical protein
MSNFRIRNGGSVFFVYIKAPLPEGYNHIGSVSIDNSSSPIYVDISSSTPLHVDISTNNPLTYQNVNETIGKVMYADSASNDAFSRLRISNTNTLFDGALVDNCHNEIFDISFVNGANFTYNQTQSTMTFDVSRSGQFVKRQSHFRARYQPGKSLLILASFYFGTFIPSGAYQRIGFFDEDEGIYLQQDSSGISWNLKSESIGTTIPVSQSNWNIDSLNGSGPSGITLDLTQTNIIVIDLQWLGVGRIRVGFQNKGRIIYCHQFNIDDLSYPYIRTPYQPVRTEVGTITNQSQNVSVKQICCSMISEGGYDPVGYLRSYIMENTKETNISSYTPILSIRLKQPFYRGQIFPISFSVSASNQLVFLKLFYRCSLTGANFTSASDYAEVDVSATSLSGGYTIDSDYVTTQSNFTFQNIPELLLGLQSNINRDCDILTLAAKSSSGTPSVRANLVWKEII